MSKNLAIIILVLAFGFAAGWVTKCNSTADVSPVVGDTITKTDTLYKTDTIPFPVYVPTPFTVIDTFWKSQKIDTVAILQAFFNKNTYNDTLVNDSSLLVVVNDTVCQNQIQSRIPFIVRNFPTITKTNTVYATADKWFVGSYAGKSMGAEITYLNKKNMFGFGGGTNGVYVKYSRQIK